MEERFKIGGKVEEGPVSGISLKVMDWNTIREVKVEALYGVVHDYNILEIPPQFQDLQVLHVYLVFTTVETLIIAKDMAEKSLVCSIECANSSGR
jgi:hypothetical protein